MYEVVPGLLWIGNALDARNPRVLFDAEIAVVVDIAYEELPAQLPREIAYCRFPLLDGAGNDPRFMQFAIEAVISFLTARISTIVCCSGGMSRSPAIVAGALSVVRGQPIAEILHSITASHHTIYRLHFGTTFFARAIASKQKLISTFKTGDKH